MRKKVKTDETTKQVAGMLKDIYGHGTMRASQGTRLQLSRQLNHFAGLAGVAREVNQSRAELYLAIAATHKLDGEPLEDFNGRVREVWKQEKANMERAKALLNRAPTRERTMSEITRDTKTHTETFPYSSLMVPIGDEEQVGFGLLPGDTVIAEQCLDPQPGDLLFITERDKPEAPTCSVGRFDGFEDCETGRKYAIEWPNGKVYLYGVTMYCAYKATTIHRPVKHGEASSETERKLKRLHARLEKMDADEITDSTAIFKLEKQIYDLEHPIDLDDWSAWEEGAAL